MKGKAKFGKNMTEKGKQTQEEAKYQEETRTLVQAATQNISSLSYDNVEVLPDEIAGAPHKGVIDRSLDEHHVGELMNNFYTSGKPNDKIDCVGWLQDPKDKAETELEIGNARIIMGDMLKMASLLPSDSAFDCLYADLPYNISELQHDQEEINEENVKTLLNAFSVVGNSEKKAVVFHCHPSQYNMLVEALTSTGYNTIETVYWYKKNHNYVGDVQKWIKAVEMMLVTFNPKQASFTLNLDPNLINRHNLFVIEDVINAERVPHSVERERDTKYSFPWDRDKGKVADVQVAVALDNIPAKTTSSTSPSGLNPQRPSVSVGHAAAAIRSSHTTQARGASTNIDKRADAAPFTNNASASEKEKHNIPQVNFDLEKQADILSAQHLQDANHLDDVDDDDDTANGRKRRAVIPKSKAAPLFCPHGDIALRCHKCKLSPDTQLQQKPRSEEEHEQPENQTEPSETITKTLTNSNKPTWRVLHEERLAKEREEREKLEKAKDERDRATKERREKKQKQKLELEGSKREKSEQEEAGKAKREQEQEKEKLAIQEKERLPKERVEKKKKAEMDREEKAKQQQEHKEKLARQEKEQIEREREEKEQKAERDRTEKARQEQEHKEKLARQEKERIEREREREETERKEKREREEKAKQEQEEKLARQEKERIEREREEKEKKEERERTEKAKQEQREIAEKKVELARAERAKQEQKEKLANQQKEPKEREKAEKEREHPEKAKQKVLEDKTKHAGLAGSLLARAKSSEGPAGSPLARAKALEMAAAAQATTKPSETKEKLKISPAKGKMRSLGAGLNFNPMMMGDLPPGARRPPVEGENSASRGEDSASRGEDSASPAKGKIRSLGAGLNFNPMMMGGLPPGARRPPVEGEDSGSPPLPLQLQHHKRPGLASDRRAPHLNFDAEFVAPVRLQSPLIQVSSPIISSPDSHQDFPDTL
eukprot:g41677.t1